MNILGEGAGLLAAEAIPVALRGAGAVAASGAKAAGNAAMKLADISPVASQIRTQNIKGALNELTNQVGGKEALNKIVQEAADLGTSPKVGDAVETAALAKEKIGEVGEKIEGFNPKSTIAQNAKNAAQSELKKANEAVDFLQNNFLNKEKITKGQETILTAARADARVAKILQGIVKTSPEAANKLKEMINKDAQRVIGALDTLIGDEGGIKNSVKAYQSGVKANFGEVIDTLEKTHTGIYTRLDFNDPEAVDFLTQLGQISSGMWGFRFRPEARRIVGQLIEGRGVGIRDINSLREELNKLITAADGTQKYALKSIKDFVDGKLMDDIISQGPNAAASRELYQTALNEYRDMAQISQSQWGKMAANNDKGDASVIAQMNKTLDEASEANSVDLFLSKLPAQEASKVELNIIKGLLDQLTQQHSKGVAIDYGKLTQMLAKKKFQSEDAKGFIELIGELNRVIGQDAKIAAAADKFAKSGTGSEGISQSVVTRFITKLANITTKNVLRLTPGLGNEAALIHHLTQAAKNSQDYDGYIKNIMAAARDKNTDTPLKRALIKYAAEINKARSEQGRIEQNNRTILPPPKGGAPVDGGGGTKLLPPPKNDGKRNQKGAIIQPSNVETFKAKSSKGVEYEVKIGDINAEGFTDQVKANIENLPSDSRWRVTAYEPNDYKGATTKITENGSTVAIKDGDIVSVSSRDGEGTAMLQWAVKMAAIG